MSHPKSCLYRAKEHGCNSCGVRGIVFYTVEFYILPSRLVRKRHKEREQTAVYCQPCYEKHSELPFFVDDDRRVISRFPSEEPQERPCPVCGKPFDAIFAEPGGEPRLYGVVSVTLWMELSPEEGQCLATICGECVEAHKISLVAKLNRDFEENEGKD